VIVGIGVDLVAVARLESALGAWGARLERRLFTEAEAAFCRAQRASAAAFAARFAAKEAFAKALGTGVTAGLRWPEIEVTRDAAGRPGLALHGAAERAARARGVRGAHLSLSHDRGAAVAVVVLEG
jgi:holo-[acyl-carrier protein] synthase